MAFMECHYHSDVLKRACSMNVIVPQNAKTHIGTENNGTEGKSLYPVLYLLHGLSDDYTIWSRMTSIERYVRAYNVVVVMPDGERGFYTDAQQGDRYWTWLSEELPRIVCSMFPVSPKREDTFAAGNSMGGYGALKLALRCPERFAAAAGLSSVADIQFWLNLARTDFPEWMPEMERIFGSEATAVAEGNDLLTLAEKNRSAKQLPRLLMICGTEDSLYEANQNLRRKLEGLQWPDFCYEEDPGNHCWDYWDAHLKRVLQFLLDPVAK